MLRIGLIACMFQVFIVAASAQTQKLPPDLAGLPDEIKTLNWKSIDPSKVSPLEHCRALLLMNHTLDELSANATAEADLMSTFIEKQNLGAQFASTPPPPAPTMLSYADAEKVAVALLRGPMSKSYYATELADISTSGLVSYEQMYERTCQRRWSEFDESRHLVRCMTTFLGNSQRLQDYDAWATAETARRESEYRQHAAGNAAGGQAPPQQSNAQNQQVQQQLQQVQGALGAAEYQQQALAQQEAVLAAQQQSPQQQQPGQVQQQPAPAQQTYPPGYVAPTYGGYGGYGTAPAGAAAAGAYAGATAANSNQQKAGAAAAGAAAANANNQNKVSPAAAAAAGQYHGANSSWNKDSAYKSSAQAQTEQRMSSFHGAPSSSAHGAPSSAGHGGEGRR